MYADTITLSNLNRGSSAPVNTASKNILSIDVLIAQAKAMQSTQEEVKSKEMALPSTWNNSSMILAILNRLIGFLENPNDPAAEAHLKADFNSARGKLDKNHPLLGLITDCRSSIKAHQEEAAIQVKSAKVS